ncbi:MAG: hypothetical protein ABGX17_07115 [Desulfurobacteriaceae bacterium]
MGEFELEVMTDGGRKINLSDLISVEEIASTVLRSFPEDYRDRFFEEDEVPEDFGRELLLLLLKEASNLVSNCSFSLQERGEILEIVCKVRKRDVVVIAKKSYPATLVKAMNLNGANGLLKVLESMVLKIDKFSREWAYC